MKQSGGVGLQLRLGTSITELAYKALRLELSCFQCFLTVQATGNSFILKRPDAESFLSLRDRFGSLFLHASYQSNLADPRYERHPRLEHEVRLAERLGFTHLVVHAGAFPATVSREEGLLSVARSINQLLAQSSSLKVTLENVAHAKRTLCGSIEDLGAILMLCKYPERLYFCLDTAHAHSFGYDLLSPSGRTTFLDDFDRLCGRDRLALIHLNDTTSHCGDHVDIHCAVGAGVLGREALPALCADERLKKIPFLLEMPALPEHDELSLVRQVALWRSIIPATSFIPHKIVDGIR